jgi:aspartyl/glutamyl-tRNA(Asn/Gln) amidotransferase C subunit
MDFDVKRFSDLARIRITKSEEDRFRKDFSKILNHFRELQEINTEKVQPVVGGTDLKNVFREDSLNEPKEYFTDKPEEQFPEKKDGYLKVPKVFE